MDDNIFRQSILSYSAQIGCDPLIVQGAGGNISWKQDDTLWVKASGMWLADALKNEIFVPVSLSELRTSISAGDFETLPAAQDSSLLRPSIETLLHAIMPQRVVVHVHAIEVLARLVRKDNDAELMSLVDPQFSYVTVDYQKPGAALALAVNKHLISGITPDIVLMKNHGVVIGADSIQEIDVILKSLLANFRITQTLTCVAPIKKSSVTPLTGYIPVPDSEINLLATHEHLFSRLSRDWVLYPDHVVFLGPAPYTFKTMEALNAFAVSGDDLADVVFVENEGVFVLESINKARLQQLRCYYDVLVRQPYDNILRCLTSDEIGELLNWDAEKYRMRIAK